MKLYIGVLLYCSFLYPQTQEKIPPKTQEKINKGIDYYNVSLYEDSKKIFLDLLYSDDGKKYEAEIRYHLGLASFYAGYSADAKIQWRKLIKNFPTHKRSKALSRTADRWSNVKDERDVSKEEDREFDAEKTFSELFWDPKQPDYKLLYGELKDAAVAIKYYEKMYEKYDDPSKKFEVTVRLFALYAGFNNNDYGYNNQSSYGPSVSDDPYKSLNIGLFASKAGQLLNQMNEHITDENDVNYSSYIMWNYLWAVKLSDTEFWSEKARSNKNSEPFFAKVIGLTNNEPDNVYRLFSIMYLGEKAKKYIVSDESLAKYTSYGLTNEDILSLSQKGVPEDYWIRLKQRNLDLNKIFNIKNFIISLRLEDFLIKNNLITKYTFDNLHNSVQDIEGWSTLFLDPNPPVKNKELMSFIFETFNCKDIDCYRKNKDVIKSNLNREIRKQVRRYENRDQLLVTFMPLSTLLIIKLNNISPEDFSIFYGKQKKDFIVK